MAQIKNFNQIFIETTWQYYINFQTSNIPTKPCLRLLSRSGFKFVWSVIGIYLLLFSADKMPPARSHHNVQIQNLVKTFAFHIRRNRFSGVNLFSATLSGTYIILLVLYLEISVWLTQPQDQHAVFEIYKISREQRSIIEAGLWYWI